MESETLVASSHSSSNTARIVVSIINYKTADLTITCAQSVVDALVGFDGHIVIVDNNSADGSVEKISAWIRETNLSGRVQLVASPVNTGFSGGQNLGIRTREADYHLILNSDAFLKPGFFTSILAEAKAQPSFGFYTPRIDFENGDQQTSCFRFPSPASELIRGAETAQVTRLLSQRDVPLNMPPAPDQIEWASFACILVRADVLRDVGLMDEGYFLYFEDVEFCWRARQKGWRICYVPEARAVHYHGGSGPMESLAKAKKRLPAYYYASRTRFFWQVYGTGGLLLANFAWFFGRAVAVARVLFGKDIPPSNQREYRDIWINILSPLGDRRQPMN